MMRVYGNLKRRIMDGEFASGARLDPARLRSDLAASTTPIRDALHRLTGEGLVESWQNEGFRIVHLSEPELRDHYEWSHLLTRAAVDIAADRFEPHRLDPPVEEIYPDEVTMLLQTIAALSPNLELRRAMGQLCDRAFPYRWTEALLLQDAVDELRAIYSWLERCDWTEVRAAIERFHTRRLEIVPKIAALLRERGAVVR